jgi:hypothetical protein
MLAIAALLVAAAAVTSAEVVKDFQALGGIADVPQMDAMKHNQQLLQATLQGLQPGDRFVVPNVTFWLLGGISVHGVHDAVIQIDGTLAFSNTRATWPTDAKGHVLECLTLDSFRNVTFTSGGHGTIDGNGTAWWGAINFAIYGENRPRLLALPNSQDVLVEHILFKNSPYWTFYAQNANNLIIRYSEVDARITNQSIHTLEDLTAFNTDGFDGA